LAQATLAQVRLGWSVNTDKMCERCAVLRKRAPVELQILETFEERQEFLAELRGKRVLHVKGFGNSLSDLPEEEQGLGNNQEAEVLLAVQNFAPDFLVVDGDPWGEGFQMHMKQYIDDQHRLDRHSPRLIWARSATLVGEQALLVDDEERNERLEQAREWAAQGFSVIVYWVCMERINQQINKLFGQTFVEDNQASEFDARGLVQIMADPLLPWVQGLAHDSHRSILSKWLSNFLLWSILAIESPDRGDKQYFQKQSFEQAAMGNLIFDLLHTRSAAKHGVVCCGGGEPVLLEIATKYLNQNFEALHEHVAIFPFSHGDDTEYPLLPKYMGLSFISSSYTLTHLSRHVPSSCVCTSCFSESVDSRSALSRSSRSLPDTSELQNFCEQMESTPVHASDSELNTGEQIDSCRSEPLSCPRLILRVDSDLHIEAHMDTTPVNLETPVTVNLETPVHTAESKLDAETQLEEQMHATPVQATDSDLCVDKQMHATSTQTADAELRVEQQMEAKEQMDATPVRATDSEQCVDRKMHATSGHTADAELRVEEQMEASPVHADNSEMHIKEQMDAIPVQATDVELRLHEQQVKPTSARAAYSELRVEEQIEDIRVPSANSYLHVKEPMEATVSELRIEEPTKVSELCIEEPHDSSVVIGADSELHIKDIAQDSKIPELSSMPCSPCGVPNRASIEGSVREWIESVTGFASSNQTMAEYLRDGQVLCALANAVKPGSIRKVNSSKMNFKQMENITHFIKAARDLGVPEGSLFGTSDLYEAKNMVSVFRCVYVFAGVIQVVCPEFSGPYLGPAMRPDVQEKKRASWAAGQTICKPKKQTLVLPKIICSRLPQGGIGSSSLTNLQAKQSSKVSIELENGICAWIEGVTLEVKGDQTMHRWLKSGEVLCRLANIVKPGLVQRINSGSVSFKQMENISFFRDAARQVGVPEFCMFRLLDLYEEKNMESVVSCLQAFADAVQANCPEFTGPILADALKNIKVNDVKACWAQKAISRYEAMQRTMEEERP